MRFLKLVFHRKIGTHRERLVSLETALMEAESARAEAESARAEAESARAEAESARAEAESARAEAEHTRNLYVTDGDPFEEGDATGLGAVFGVLAIASSAAVLLAVFTVEQVGEWLIQVNLAINALGASLVMWAGFLSIRNFRSPKQSRTQVSIMLTALGSFLVAFAALGQAGVLNAG
jgi:hypothetical protein